MGDNINQKNIFGGNMANSTKNTTVKIVFTKHRAQGLIAGILLSMLASYFYDLIKSML